MIQGSERTEPRNHYTTAPLVITRVTRITSSRRFIPASAIKNTSKNRRCNQIDLIMRWSLTNRWTAALFEDRLNLSKTQTLKWRWLLYKRELGACKSPGRNPNGLQHGTRANGPTDGDTAPCQILDTHLCRTIPIDSEGILRWDRCHLKLYEIVVPTIYRTSKSDSVCDRGVSKILESEVDSNLILFRTLTWVGRPLLVLSPSCGRTNLNYIGSSTRVHFWGLHRTSNGIIPWPVG
jgi:hypothetical protein